MTKPPCYSYFSQSCVLRVYLLLCDQSLYLAVRPRARRALEFEMDGEMDFEELHG